MWTLIILWDVGFSIRQFEITNVWPSDIMAREIRSLTSNERCKAFAIYNPYGKVYEITITDIGDRK